MACSRFIGRVFESPEVMDIRLLCLSCRYRPLRRAHYLFRGVLLSLVVCGIVCDVETSAEAVQARFGLYSLKQKIMLYSAVRIAFTYVRNFVKNTEQMLFSFKNGILHEIPRSRQKNSSFQNFIYYFLY